MTIEERLLFLRAGYSAQDIASFEASDNAQTGTDHAKPLADPAQTGTDRAEPAADPAANPDTDAPAWVRALQASVDNMTAAIQASNRSFVDMGDPGTSEQAADAALAAYITGATAPENNTSKGGKHK